MYGFHFLVSMFGVKGIRDTQCGFKLTTRQAACLIYPSLHVERWAFDVELLYIAKQLKMPISEVAVHWTEIEGKEIFIYLTCEVFSYILQTLGFLVKTFLTEACKQMAAIHVKRRKN